MAHPRPSPAAKGENSFVSLEGQTWEPGELILLPAEAKRVLFVVTVEVQ